MRHASGTACRPSYYLKSVGIANLATVLTPLLCYTNQTSLLPSPITFVMNSLRAHRGSYLLEFGPSLLVVILVMFPLIDLMGLLCGAAGVQFLAYRACCAASVQQRFQDSLSSMQAQSADICNSGLGTFSRLKPVAGYGNSGSDLLLMVTDIFTSQVTTAPPNCQPSGPVDTTTNIYECAVVSTCEVGPVINLAGIPFVRDVPALGRPATIKARWVRAWEHPHASLTGGQGTFSGGTSAIKLSDVNGLNNPGSLTNLIGSGWNYPNIYAIIASAGQTPTQEEVLEVHAKNGAWTNTTISLQPGDKLWVDLEAKGTWSMSTCWTNYKLNHMFYDADGYSGLGQDQFGNTYGAIVGRIGSSGTPFTVGKKMWNALPPGSGNLQLIANDIQGQHFDNRGSMIVRIIVAR